MVPIYSVVSFLSYYFYTRAVYFEVIRDCYEAFAIASFYSLLCAYVAPDLHDQKDYFRKIRPRGWVLPIPWLKRCCGGEVGIWRTPRSGLTWFNVSGSATYVGFIKNLTLLLDHLVWRLSILLRASLHDYSSSHNTGCWKILFRIYQSSFCSRLGKLSFPRCELEARLLNVLGYGHRRKLRISSYVLSHPILHTTQKRPRGA